MKRRAVLAPVLVVGLALVVGALAVFRSATDSGASVSPFAREQSTNWCVEDDTGVVTHHISSGDPDRTPLRGACPPTVTWIERWVRPTTHNSATTYCIETTDGSTVYRVYPETVRKDYDGSAFADISRGHRSSGGCPRR